MNVTAVSCNVASRHQFLVKMPEAKVPVSKTDMHFARLAKQTSVNWV